MAQGTTITMHNCFKSIRIRITARLHYIIVPGFFRHVKMESMQTCFLVKLASGSVCIGLCTLASFFLHKQHTLSALLDALLSDHDIAGLPSFPYVSALRQLVGNSLQRTENDFRNVALSMFSLLGMLLCFVREVLQKLVLRQFVEDVLKPLSVLLIPVFLNHNSPCGEFLLPLPA